VQIKKIKKYRCDKCKRTNIICREKRNAIRD